MSKLKIEFLRYYCGQPIYLSVLDNLEDVKVIEFPQNYYRVLVILEHQNYATKSLRKFVENLLESGCRYIMTFGTDAEKLHNEADWAIVNGGYEKEDDDCIPTTSHELIEEAIWFAGNLAVLSPNWDSSVSPLVIVLHGSSRISNVKQLVLDIESLEKMEF